MGTPPGGEACVAAGAVPALVSALKSQSRVAGVKGCAVIAIIDHPAGGIYGQSLLTSLGYSEYEQN